MREDGLTWGLSPRSRGARGASLVVTTVLVGLALLSAQIAAGSSGRGVGQPLSFALLGDTPYGPEQTADFPRLIDDVNDDPHVRFVLHVGDVKAGSTPCSDELLTSKLELYQTFEDPFVLTPGDNEWTDCHREAAGRYLPTERLAFLRETFYPEPGTTLGRRTMQVDTQADSEEHADHVENQLFTRSGVVFSAIHVVGSNNDLEPWSQLPGGDRPVERHREYASRLDAALAWLDHTFERARRDGAAGVFLMIHANPRIELEADDPDRRGFTTFLDGFEDHAAAFDGPVVLDHGDLHELLIDHPFAALPNVTRVQTFGAEIGHWLRVTVDPRSAALFSFGPVRVPRS